MHVYIHYPYCLYKCHYCDFNSHAYERADIPQTGYVDSVLAEIHKRYRLWQEGGTHFLAPGSEIASIFFGGGTPSLMPPAEAARLIAELAKIYRIADDCEITLESNPGTVDLARFRDFRAAGINRISLGVQSLDDKNLAAFGRIHTAVEAKTALAAALEAGFKRVSADLIFGFPGQTLADWESDLDGILKFGLKHLSCYALTAEEGTKFTADVKKGIWAENDPDVVAEMLTITRTRLAQAGLPAYEISNYAKTGEESRHNLGYWHFRDYLGLGAGAWSQFLPLRTMNHKIPDHYRRSVAANDFFVTETIEPKTAMKEFLMMGLRLTAGVSESAFFERFGISLESQFRDAIVSNVISKRLFWDGSVLRPTETGMIFNQDVVRSFF